MHSSHWGEGRKGYQVRERGASHSILLTLTTRLRLLIFPPPFPMSLPISTRLYCSRVCRPVRWPLCHCEVNCLSASLVRSFSFYCKCDSHSQSATTTNSSPRLTAAAATFLFLSFFSFLLVTVSSSRVSSLHFLFFPTDSVCAFSECCVRPHWPTLAVCTQSVRLLEVCCRTCIIQ